MKKTLYYAMAWTTAVLFATCSQEEVTNIQGEGAETMVAFTVQLPDGVQSRAGAVMGDGTKATTLSYAVYEQGDASKKILFSSGQTDVAMQGNKATVSLRLAVGKAYDLLFWADAYAAGEAQSPYNVDFATQTVTVDYAEANANDEKRDAFYAKESLMVERGTTVHSVALKRPFAQLNIATSDLQDAKKAGLAVDGMLTWVKVAGIPNQMNLMDGSVSGAAEVTLKEAARPTEQLTFGGMTYDYLGMNYLLVGADKSLHACSFYHKDGQKVNELPIANLPLQRNWRTSVVGDLLTNAFNFTVSIDNGFVGIHTRQEVTSAAEWSAALTDVLQKGGEIYIPSGVEIQAPEVDKVTLTHPTVLTIDGTLTSTKEQFFIENKSDLTIRGKGTLKMNRYVVDNYGSLTVKGGTYTTSYKNGGSAFYNNLPDNRLALENVTINASHFAVCGGGSVDIKGGTFTTTASTEDGDNIWAYAICANQENGNFTITDAAVEGRQGGIAATKGATVTVKNTSCKTTYKHGVAYQAEGHSKLILENVTADAEYFAVRGMSGANVTIKGGTFKSSATTVKGYYCYAIAAQENCTMTIENAVVKGIQGCIYSIGTNASVTLTNVTAEARDSAPGKGDAYYALYSAQKGNIEVNSGSYYSDRTPCCLVSDNDLNLPLGVMVLKGGKYSSMPQTNIPNYADLLAAEGYEFKEIMNGGDFKYEVVKK